MTRTSARALGVATIAFAVLLNTPYAILATMFDYPAVLRRPAGEVLQRFNEGGPALLFTWHAFALAALLFVPLSIALGLRADVLVRSPTLSIGAAIAGSLAGVTQAIGLWRWVFVVPVLARTSVDPSATDSAREAATRTFEVLNLYGGVAIGEHLGQWLTALFVLFLSLRQAGEGARLTAGLGLVSAFAIAVGTTEGLAIALGRSGDVFGLVTVAGFLGLSLWLVATGLGLLRGSP